VINTGERAPSNSNVSAFQFTSKATQIPGILQEIVVSKVKRTYTFLLHASLNLIYDPLGGSKSQDAAPE
jgi:hypothetical protein